MVRAGKKKKSNAYKHEFRWSSVAKHPQATEQFCRSHGKNFFRSESLQASVLSWSTILCCPKQVFNQRKKEYSTLLTPRANT